LLEPVELRKHAMIAPSAQFRYRREYEPPRADEGFAAIEDIVFTVRAAGLNAPQHVDSDEETKPIADLRRRPALLIELDDLVWRGRPRGPGDLQLVDGIRDRLRAWVDAGYMLAGTTWLTPPSLDDRLAELLDVPIAIARCVHPAGPPICWCRKPLPGMALLLAKLHRLELAASVHVGKNAADRGFALRAGLRYVDIADGFPSPGVATPANSAS
jgi:hypothetical protein